MRLPTRYACTDGPARAYPLRALFLPLLALRRFKLTPPLATSTRGQLIAIAADRFHPRPEAICLQFPAQT